MIDKHILIVEDEPLIAEDMHMCLKDEGYKNIHMAYSYNEAISVLEGTQPDIGLIDINLSGKKDGVDLATQINKYHKFPFIFVTSYYDDETRDRLKKVNPSGYIIKPFNETELIINVEMVLNKSRDNSSTFSDKVFIKSGQDLLALDPKNILYVEAFDNYAKIYTTDEMHIVSHTLKSIQEKLINQGFVRIHKSFLINFQKIKMISEGHVYVESSRLPIGKAYKHFLLSQISTL